MLVHAWQVHLLVTARQLDTIGSVEDSATHEACFSLVVYNGGSEGILEAFYLGFQAFYLGFQTFLLKAHDDLRAERSEEPSNF